MSRFYAILMQHLAAKNGLKGMRQLKPEALRF
jgi:hypothetical protein